MSDRVLDVLQRELDGVDQVGGVTRELVLLRAFNRGFEHFATLEPDWRGVNALTHSKWREQVARLLEWLEFQVESADCYAPEPTGLAARVGGLRQQVEETTALIERLSAEAERLDGTLGTLSRDRARCEREVATLKALAELMPWRDRVLEALGAERLRELADGKLAAAAGTVREEVEHRLGEARARLEAAEQRLAEGLSLKEQELKALHERMSQVARSR
jgi:prefoldin subunit 5